MDRVAIELIKKLQEIDTDNQYFIFVKRDEDDTAIEERPNFKIVCIDGGPYPYWEQVLLVREVAKYNLDVLHCTNNTAPLRCPVPLVVTVHDIIYLERFNLTKGTAYQIFGNLYRRWNVPRIIKKAARVLTVSDFERKNIDRYFTLSDHQVQTVYNAVSEFFKPVDDPAVCDKIREKYQLPASYVFCLGNADPRKNMGGILKALSVLRERGMLTFKVLLLGISKDFIRQEADKIQDPAVVDAIIFPGYVPDADLPALYSMADLFLYPSLREGFGIPILEAMSCKTPVVTANTSSMPEVAGDGALLVDPYNPESIADGVQKLLQDKGLQASLVQKGTQRVPLFTWHNNAVQTLNIYEEVVGH